MRIKKESSVLGAATGSCFMGMRAVPQLHRHGLARTIKVCI